MSFDPALYDGSDPAYAPGLQEDERRGTYTWRAPKKYVAAGYRIKSMRLEGRVGDGKHMERAAKCRELTREMLRWYGGSSYKVEPGTWGELIARYKSDAVSPFQSVKANTRDAYMFCLARWEAAIGHLDVRDASFASFMEWRLAMEQNGRSTSYIHRMFTTLRIVVGYGVALSPALYGPLRAILGQMRVRVPKARKASPTRAQVLSVVAKADAAGEHSFALGVLLQFWLTLRAIDVRGNWYRMRPGEERSGITRGTFRWGDGLTWDMIDGDVTTLAKVASKTERVMQDEMVFDLTLLPDVRERLLAVPVEKRVGPVIVDKRGMPFDRYTWSDLWRKFRREAGVPEHIWLMDVRAGAINDARARGADRLAMQFQANHATPTTTDRYIRERDEARNNVIRMRTGK